MLPTLDCITACNAHVLIIKMRCALRAADAGGNDTSLSIFRVDRLNKMSVCQR